MLRRNGVKATPYHKNNQKYYFKDDINWFLQTYLFHCKNLRKYSLV